MKKLIAPLLAVAVLGFSLAHAEDKKDEKAKPYPLKTCMVADEKLGEMGDPFVFVYQGQEIKLCCKSCKKDFDKDPKKFLKKLEKDDKKK
jgi:YHS domain-containing protein